MFEGVSVALVTPFREGALDEEALRGLCKHVLEQGVDALFPTGCTGEAATLSVSERKQVWKICVEEAKGKAKVVAGTGTNDTVSSLALTREAAECGVDGCMLITPYYNKPSAQGLIHHYHSIAEAVDIPLVLYNVPGRTGLNISPNTTAQLAQCSRIVAIKEAGGSVDQVTDLLARNMGLTVLSGDDTLTLPMAAAGAGGVVSVVGHVAGAEVKAMLLAHRRGEINRAAELHQALFGLTRALFVESNPGPVKALLAYLGLVVNELRSPLVPVGEDTVTTVVSAWETFRQRTAGAVERI